MKYYPSDITYVLSEVIDFTKSVIRSKFKNFYDETSLQIMYLDRISILARSIRRNLISSVEERLNFELETKQITTEEYDEKIKLLQLTTEHYEQIESLQNL
jgi:hypothetical protein